MHIIERHSHHPGETEALAQALGACLTGGEVVTLAGDLGAGKTAFARGLAAGLGITEPVSSPTFALVQDYPGRLHLYHVDLYRLATPDDLAALGIDELLGAPGTVCAVEWPERGEGWWPPETLRVQLRPVAAEERLIRLELPDELAEKLIQPPHIDG